MVRAQELSPAGRTAFRTVRMVSAVAVAVLSGAGVQIQVQSSRSPAPPLVSGSTATVGGVHSTAGFVNGQDGCVAEEGQSAGDAVLGEDGRDGSQVLAGEGG
jgi:hypothetical protein